jgi:thioredoxin 1
LIVFEKTIEGERVNPKGPIQFSDASFKTDVLESKQPVLVDFWAQWCGPCHALAPTIEELAHDFEGAVKVGKINIDENPETAAAYGIRSIPSVLLFKDGAVVEHVVGVRDKTHYREALEQVRKNGGAESA